MLHILDFVFLGWPAVGGFMKIVWLTSFFFYSSFYRLTQFDWRCPENISGPILRLKLPRMTFKNHSSQCSDRSIWFFKVIRVIWDIRFWIKYVNTWIPIQLRLTRDTYQHIEYLCNIFDVSNRHHRITI
jgi:hypothetical protein